MPRTVAAAVGRLLAPSRTRLLAMSVTSCGLLLLLLEVNTPTPRPHLSVQDRGRLRGQLISELWDSGRPAHAWFSSAECRAHVTRYTRDHSVPLVYLASFPRSGNTWTRYLLEASTGLFTAGNRGPNYRHYATDPFTNNTLTDEDIWNTVNTVKRDGQLVKFGYLGDYMPWTQGVTIVSKTHNWPEPWTKEEAEIVNKTHDILAPFPEHATRRAVLLIRDPFKSLISMQKYSKTGSVLNEEDMPELFHGQEWEKLVTGYARIWYDLNSLWIQSTAELHVIAYERLTQDPFGELASLLRFLDVEPDQRRMECLRRHLEGKAHNRRHGVVPDKQTYPLLERAELWKHIHELNWLLKDRGYPSLPLERYSFVEEFGDV